jgi:hypothetical protein
LVKGLDGGESQGDSRPPSIAGGSTTLAWSAKEASSCGASGAWNGSMGNSGTKVVKVGSNGNYNFTFTCQNTSGATGSTTLSVIAQ